MFDLLSRKLSSNAFLVTCAGEKAVVDCSFITEFEDHIFVTIDAEAFFFLHDLISSYLKEKEKVVRTVEIFLCVEFCFRFRYPTWFIFSFADYFSSGSQVSQSRGGEKERQRDN